ncbi:hypothetical protein SAMN05444344_2280 [Tenacibaculum mesophilum]|uniref:Uncharacterized protein n=1 Tax=Tenacibaculum caenipelagi TaxID=1325435 RepID=A0A4R6TEB5_9FLAO|nr:hypothetical protein C8N27_1989 [Tenacibaculum discolor]TDQ27723.1 hypothetical protein DFQ07_1574 [Tenacibaculum caenipelagi]SHF97966.1 hypothetical protein SAMN05444344_2280 [Tenacibaculum mesophilum]
MNTFKYRNSIRKHVASTVMYSVQNPFYRDPELLILNP